MKKTRTIFNAMKEKVENALNNIKLDLLSLDEGESTNKETGEVSHFLRMEAEVPKGYDELSRCRFNVKILNGKRKISDEELDENDYSVIFEGLQISYIDNKGNVYFRADDYTVKKET